MGVPGIHLHEMDLFKREKALQSPSSCVLHGRIISFNLSVFFAIKRLRNSKKSVLYTLFNAAFQLRAL